MFKKICNYTLSDLDFPWCENTMRKYKQRYAGVDAPNDNCYQVITSDKNYSKLSKIALLHDIPSEHILNDKAVNKWNKPQGGTFSQANLENGVESYYDSKYTMPDSPLDEELVDEAIYEVYKTFSSYGYLGELPYTIEKNSRVIWNVYKADHRSAAGFIADEDRRSISVRKEAIKDIENYLQLHPVIGGMRRKDAKDRNIFNDDISNYFKEVKMFESWFRWWRRLPYDMHVSDYRLARNIAICNAKSAYAGDYASMDKHYGVHAFKKVALAYGTLTGSTLEELQTIYMFSEELFSTECIAGSTLYKGTHTLYSGIYPTHDFESPKNFIILHETARRCNFVVVKDYKPLRSNECMIVVCGDDSIVLFGRRLSADEFKQFADTHKMVASAFGQIVEVEKVDTSYDYITFCKKTFALRQDVKGFKHYNDKYQTPIHKFSVLKAIHCLYQPEKLPKFDQRGLVIWTASIMDNAYGNVDWKATCIALYQQNRDLFDSFDYDDYTISSETQLLLDDDWWFRNYVSFELQSSPFINLMKWCTSAHI